MLYCFLDTNIFLQCKDFDQINWHKDIDWGGLDSKEICLVVAPIVIRELDNFKVDARSARRQERAKKTLKKIKQLWIAEQPYASLREKVVIKIIPEMPTKAKLVNIGYEIDLPDNQLLAAILLFLDENINETAILLTLDTGILLKASLLNIKTIDAPEEILLPPELDEDQKLIKALQKENASLKSQKPEISIGFLDNNSIKQVIDFHIPDFEYTGILDEELEQEISKKKEEMFYPFPSSTLATSFSPLIDLFSPTVEEIKEYNKACEEYLQEDYVEYIKELSFYNHIVKLTKLLNIVIQNTGTLPAKDIDVWLHFPDGVRLSNEELKSPYKPREPQKPRGRLGILGDMIPRPDPEIYLAGLSDQYQESKPQIRKTNSYEVKHDYASLKHNMTWNWPLWITLTKSPQVMPVISIDYRITVANLPQMLEGQLTIKLSSG